MAGRTIPALLFALAMLGAVLQPATACNPPVSFPNQKLLATMRHGFNLPGWERPEPQGQLQAARAAGFDHVRLPLDGSLLLETASENYLDAMTEQVRRLLDLGFTVAVDLHAGDLSARPDAAALLADLWRRIAPRLASSDPARVAVELLNEPHADGDEWRRIAEALVATIRPILPAHSIIMGPAGPQRHEALAGMDPLDDRNIIYAVHYYDPFPFTHQGQDWGRPGDPLRVLAGLPFPTTIHDPDIQAGISRLEAEGQTEAAALLKRTLTEPWTKAAMIDPAFDMMKRWSETHDRPVIVNEFGVLKHVSDPRSRLNWLEAVTDAARERCIGWTHWDFQDGFGLLDSETGKLDEAVVRALLKN